MQHKFRAWDKKYKVFCEKTLNLRLTGLWGKITGKNSFIIDIPDIDLICFTGFYAGGIVDEKNEIYADHILEVESVLEFEKNKKMIGHVYFDSKYGIWEINFGNGRTGALWIFHKKAKIIGSVQEKPELLESNN